MDKDRFFVDQIIDFTITKPNFPEKNLAYVNPGSAAPVKSELTIYLDSVILGQPIPEMNNSDNIEEYECKPKEVKLITPLYDVDSGKFLGLEKRLAFFLVRGDQDEAFFSYGYDKSRSKKLYSTSKKLLPNIFRIKKKEKRTKAAEIVQKIFMDAPKVSEKT